MSNLISLSYIDTIYQSQKYASSSISIDSDIGSRWIGDITISPIYNNWIGDNSNIVTQKNDLSYIEWSVNTKIKPIFLTRNIWASIYNNTNSSNLLTYIDETYLIVSCSNYKPNTMLYSFIDGKNYTTCQYNINEYDTIINNDPIVTDSSGYVKFIIVIPKNELSHDIKELIICDDPLKRDTFITTIGTSYLLYSNNIQSMYTKTKSTMLSSNSVAQSFSISNIDGMFISKLGVYFKSKPNIYILQSMTTPNNTDPEFGCTIELRQIINGYPEDKVIAKTHIKYNDINISSDSSVESLIYFDDPIYLSYQSEYCFTIIPDANLNGFELWCSVINQNDILSNYKITTQPASGILYKSSNNTSWTPYQEYDLKYNLYRSRFTNSGELILTNDDSDYFTISNISGNYILGEKVYGDVTINIVEQHSSTFTYIVGNKITFNNGSVGTIKSVGNRVLTLTFQDYSILPVIGSSFTDPSNSDWNVTDIKIAEGVVYYKNYPYLTIKDSSGYFTNSQIITGLYSNTTSEIESIYNKSFSIVYPTTQEFIPSNTFIKRYIKSIRNGIITDYTEIDNLKNNEFNYEMQVYSKSNEMLHLNGDKSFYYKITMNTDTTWLSPILNSNTIECKIVYNQINNPSTLSELVDSGSNGLFRYITKTFTLNDNQDAEDLIVYITAKKPVSTDIKVYYKISHAEDSNSFNSHTWTELKTSNVHSNEFLEYKFTIPELNKEDGIVKYTINDVVYYGFKYFSIKIVGLSSNTAIYPVIKNLQIIALQK